MRLISRDQIAEAIGKSPNDFAEKLQALYSLGFPHSKTSDGLHWSVLELLDWITEKQEDAVRLVSYLAEYGDRPD